MSGPLTLGLAERAHSDINEIWDYLAQNAGILLADRIVSDFQGVFEQLCLYPHSGANRDQVMPGLRVAFQQSYAIYYVIEADTLFVVRILHTSRDVARAFK